MVTEWNNDKWTKKTANIHTWIDANGKSKDEDVKECIELVTTQLARGDKREEVRERTWNAMLLEFRHIDDAPIGGKRQSTFTDEQNEVFDELESNIIESLSNTNEAVLLTSFIRKKGADAVIESYATHQAMAEHEASKRIAGLKRMVNADTWDGTLEGLRGLQQVVTTDE